MSERPSDCTSSDPKVSVIVPAYNVASYLSETLVSLSAQTFSGFEVIVIDDGSVDETAAVAEGACARLRASGRPARIIRQENAGASAARNAGIAAAAAPLVAFLDADDLWERDLLSALVPLLDADPALDLVFPWCRYVDASGTPTGVIGRPRGGGLTLSDFVLECPIHTMTGVLVRKTALEAAGGLDEELTSYVDFDLWLRLVARDGHNVACVPRPLVAYRRRPGQLTFDWRRMAENWVRLMAALGEREPDLVARLGSRPGARHALFWSALAYQAGDLRAARTNFLNGVRAAPLHLAGQPFAWRHGLALALMGLPGPLYERLRHLSRPTS